MLALTARRTLIAIPMLLIASFALFWMVRTTFDPTARLRVSRDPQVIQNERERLHLDEPVYEQYGIWLSDFVKGDWGESARTNEPVTEVVKRSFWNTIQLIFWGILLSAIVAVALGTYSALKQYSLADYATTGLTYVGISMPPFWFGLVAIHFLAVEAQDWFNLSEPPLRFVGLHSVGQTGLNWDYFIHLVLPVMTLSVQIIASWTRYQRASTLDILSAEYIRTARAKGVPRRRVLTRHVLRNSLIPLVTVMAIDIGALFGGLIITESIFSVPGMGRLFINSLIQGDIIVLEAWMLVVAVFVLGFNLLADILYGVLDPRVRAT